MNITDRVVEAILRAHKAAADEADRVKRLRASERIAGLIFCALVGVYIGLLSWCISYLIERLGNA
jgi:hypothetical protein